MGPRSKFREMLAGGETIVAVGAFDPLTARMVEMAGFNAVYVGGWTTGAHLACSEPLTTMTEQVEAAARAARAVRLPVVVDAHAGFGDPVHVMRTVREFEASGVAAIHIEDQVFPKRVHYHKGVKHLVLVEEMVAKIKAGLRARQDPDFALIARTDAVGAVGGSVEEAIRRLQAYAEAGADILMPLVYQPADAEAIAKAVSGIPLCWQAGVGARKGTPELSVAEARRMGYQLIIYSENATLEAAGAVKGFYQQLKRDGKALCDPGKIKENFNFIDEVIRLDEYLEVEESTTERG